MYIGKINIDTRKIEKYPSEKIAKFLEKFKYKIFTDIC